MESLHRKMPHRWYILYVHTMHQDWRWFLLTFVQGSRYQVPVSPGTPQNPIQVHGDGIAAFDSAASPIPIDFYNADCSHNYLTLNEIENKVNISWMPFETPSNYSAWKKPIHLESEDKRGFSHSAISQAC